MSHYLYSPHHHKYVPPPSEPTVSSGLDDIQSLTDVIATAIGSRTPVVKSSSVGGRIAAQGSVHTVDMPAGVAVGDLLLVSFGVNGNVYRAFAPDQQGWFQLTVTATNTSYTSSRVFWKIATGSDTLTFTTGTVLYSAWTAYCITGASGVTSAILAPGNILNANTDPPAIRPLFPDDYLVVVTRFTDGASNAYAASAPPAGFTNFITTAAGAAAGNCVAQSATGTVLDPLPFTSPAWRWVCWTLAVRPSNAKASTVVDDFTTVTGAWEASHV